MFSSKIGQIKAKLLLLVGKLIRTKDPSSDLLDPASDNKLKKCLTTLDLISLGVGSCVGTGMYLVSGMVARNVAGPGVVLSFLIAAMASLFSGVCYAEFGVRVPHTTGSAYMYSYVTVGEFIAFVIGWNMISEYMIGTAAGACAISACIDAMSGGGISEAVRNNLGTIIDHTPDLVAAILTILMTMLLVAGVKKSLLFNNILNALNLAVWVFIMGAGLFYVDTNNWTSHGGFLPYGWSGVLSGAATCFYAFIGFDIIATTGEEAKNPERSIPMAIIISLFIALTAYITSSMIITLVVPYDQINPDSALVEIFQQKGAHKAKFIVAFGALAGLIVSMFGSMFPMPRVVYAMAKDGLIFRSLARVWPYTGTPMVATCVLGVTTAVVAFLMSLNVLVEMMSIGTLMAYTLVSTCVLILRYQPYNTTLVELLPESIRSACPTPSKEIATPIDDSRTTIHSKRTNRVESSDSEDSPALNDLNHLNQVQKSQRPEDLDLLVPNGSVGNSIYGTVDHDSFSRSKISGPFLKILDKIMTRLFPYEWTVSKPSTECSGKFVMKIVGVLYLLIITFDLLIVCAMPALESGDITTMLLFSMCILGIILCLIVIGSQPQTKCDLKFKTPGVPLVPTIAIIVNIYLILKLSILTLIRFTIWMILGLLMYFFYGIKNSSLDILPQSFIEMKMPESKKQKALEQFKEDFSRANLIENTNNVARSYLSLPLDGGMGIATMNNHSSGKNGNNENSTDAKWESFD
ncbi:solute carrier family 7 member 14-like isoform X1 [Tachypleus tridentatus]|uniref:solute carrier family 7 member 14-like isoform X1 n=1 Tax=Tachypleus tridentatus TaxID=6853 RepID=UPI003FD3175F